MIIFYKIDATVIQLQKQEVCTHKSLSTKKSKCCEKYRKKGINCKRCPLSEIKLRAVS